MAALTQTAANVVPGSSASTEDVVAGGTITAGMPVYSDPADSNKYKAARANVIGTALAGGVALNGASNGQPLRIQKGGNINLGATLVVGEIYCVSAAVAGLIVPYGDLLSTNIPVVLGMAETASNLKMGIFSAGVAKP